MVPFFWDFEVKCGSKVLNFIAKIHMMIYMSYFTKHFQPFLDMNDNVKVVTTQRLEDKEKGLQGAELEVASLNR